MKENCIKNQREIFFHRILNINIELQSIAINQKKSAPPLTTQIFLADIRSIEISTATSKFHSPLANMHLQIIKSFFSYI
jgi:hypothetical protein